MVSCGRGNMSLIPQLLLKSFFSMICSKEFKPLTMNKNSCKAQLRFSEGHFPLGAKRRTLSSSVGPVPGGWEDYRTSVFPTPFHLRVVLIPNTKASQWLALKFRPISSAGGKLKSSSLEAAGQTFSFCTGRELKHKSRSQDQEGKEQWH